MSKTIINLTLPVVIEEIENILDTYPEHPYRIAFAPSGLRQDLVAYVLSRIPNIYTALEETHSPSNNEELIRYCSARLLQIEHLIHLGIRDILHIYNRTNSYMLSSSDEDTSKTAALGNFGLTGISKINSAPCPGVEIQLS